MVIIATLHLSATSPTTLNWYISGLGFPWNTYSSAKITASDSSSAGALASATPDDNDTGTSTQTRTLSSGLTGGNTYTLYGWVMRGSTWYSVGSATITMPIPRPSSFSWSTSKISGQTFNLTASEWNGLCNRINQFRQYKNKSVYSFSIAYPNNNFFASMFIQARNAISEMNPSISAPPSRQSGDVILADDINRLRDSLNSIN